jgi:hypothetical protein
MLSLAERINAKRAVIVREIRQLELDIQRYSEALAEKKIRLETIDELVADDQGNDTPAMPSTNGNPADDYLAELVGLPPSKAVVAFLKANRGRMPAGAIIEALYDKIDSKSDNKKHILRTIIHQLSERGTITYQDGICTLVP